MWLSSKPASPCTRSLTWGGSRKEGVREGEIKRQRDVRNCQQWPMLLNFCRCPDNINGLKTQVLSAYMFLISCKHGVLDVVCNRVWTGLSREARGKFLPGLHPQHSPGLKLTPVRLLPRPLQSLFWNLFDSQCLFEQFFVKMRSVKPKNKAFSQFDKWSQMILKINVYVLFSMVEIRPRAS